ncbi:hypothetical protein KORDIASMS9_03646 [Kordia sp. SMS9]|uniref:hypothetical protein n=1 Tax=Kordia sp. SMS9 TaxID=2282170 RepID=UPI000E10527C|nr:hypothetical protein [Kordia sp. SMS9]AXG71389.1 hypothetical protein KORDIASMS9_03646 [Kordia sp. SMS9]
MMSWLIAFFGELFIISEEWKFYKKKKNRRAYEKANKLPKKRMLSPLTEAFFVVPVIIVAVTFVFYSFVNPIRQTRDTNDNLSALIYLLSKDKSHHGIYPENIIELSRKNPLYGDLTKDGWEREVIYQQIENGQGFTLKSKGKDGVLDTKDDIVFTEKK